ncbi:MAG: SDR family oxidoreductase [Vicinamibacteria bacterium]|nr:SDR family oxidoreductase [Vicinamibacteria bacterium]
MKFDFARRPLAGRVILVSGGTGGLGAATAALLIHEGAYPILGYHTNKGRAELVQQRLQDLYAGPVALTQGDITGAAGRRRQVEDAQRLKGRIDGLVVCAGDPARARTQDLESPAFQEALDRNAVGPLLLARDVALAMQDRSTGGAIVLLSSMQGAYPFEGSLAYGTSKAALIHGAKVLAKDFGGRSRININVVAPGVTSVGMARASVDSGKYDGMIDAGVIPRFGRPEDVARAVGLLLDPESYITGQVIMVDGGLTLRRDL